MCSPYSWDVSGTEDHFRKELHPDPLPQLVADPAGGVIESLQALLFLLFPTHDRHEDLGRAAGRG